MFVSTLGQEPVALKAHIEKEHGHGALEFGKNRWVGFAAGDRIDAAHGIARPRLFCKRTGYHAHKGTSQQRVIAGIS